MFLKHVVEVYRVASDVYSPFPVFYALIWISSSYLLHKRRNVQQFEARWRRSHVLPEIFHPVNSD